MFVCVCVYIYIYIYRHKTHLYKAFINTENNQKGYTLEA